MADRHLMTRYARSAVWGGLVFTAALLTAWTITVGPAWAFHQADLAAGLGLYYLLGVAAIQLPLLLALRPVGQPAWRTAAVGSLLSIVTVTLQVAVLPDGESVPGTLAQWYRLPMAFIPLGVAGLLGGATFGWRLGGQPGHRRPAAERW